MPHQKNIPPVWFRPTQETGPHFVNDALIASVHADQFVCMHLYVCVCGPLLLHLCIQAVDVSHFLSGPLITQIIASN